MLASPARGVRFYLVQDFEPWFYPAGSEALLAEATYRFGFHGITAGRWLPRVLQDTYGMQADHFDFGCDLDRYFLDGAPERSGVCFYARPNTDRRAFALGMAALDLFSASHPEVDIHLFGDPVRPPGFRAVSHGKLTPEQLNGVYNRCVAGLVLSASNVSLVPHEMLAAGCIPLVNDAEHNRLVLDNAQVAYAPATPFELAGSLAELVDRPAAERGRRPRRRSPACREHPGRAPARRSSASCGPWSRGATPLPRKSERWRAVSWVVPVGEPTSVVPASGQLRDQLPASPVRQVGGNSAVMRALDVVIAGVLLVLLLPVFALIAIAIRLDSPGPVLFRQRRCGLEFEQFTITKFRTMHCGAAAEPHRDYVLGLIRGEQASGAGAGGSSRCRATIASPEWVGSCGVSASTSSRNC